MLILFQLEYVSNRLIKAFSKNTDPFNAVNCGDRVVAEKLQTPKDHATDQFLILNHENGFFDWKG